ncbi:sigma-70 family RNA polymerase sigma factor [Acidobacteria bacterium AB60]|nr:sigma-70 family RNA polymerase sigma factor [Acidobacteria bacterium AB60]
MNREEPGNMSAAAVNLSGVDQNAHLGRLFAEHYRRVLMAAYRIAGNMADAEDVAQAVFLRLGSGELPDVANAGSYLYRAAINGSLDVVRRRNASAAEPLDLAAGVAWAGVGGSPETEAANRELARLLRQAIGELSGRAAEMFALRYLEELDNREIAKLLGTSAAVVAVTLHQTRSKLKKRLIEMQRGTR